MLGMPRCQVHSILRAGRGFGKNCAPAGIDCELFGQAMLKCGQQYISSVVTTPLG